MGIIVTYFSDDAMKNKVESDYIKPKIYGKLDGPIYVNLDYNKIYAIRHYEASLWVSTVVTGNFDNAWKEGLPKLKEYVKGKNQKKWLLPKTCIVTMKRTCYGHGCYGLNERLSLTCPLPEHQKTTVSLFISKHFSSEAPGPVDRTVFLQEEHKRIFYCGCYKDKFSEETAEEKIEKLQAKLIYNNETFEKGSIFVAFYNTNVKSVSKQTYFEYWVYGERIESDFKCIKTYQENNNEVDSCTNEMDD